MAKNKRKKNRNRLSTTRKFQYREKSYNGIPKSSPLIIQLTILSPSISSSAYESIVPHLGWLLPAKPYCSYDQAEKSSLHLSSCNHILLYSIHPIIPLIHILQSNHVILQATLFKLIMQFRLTGRWLRQVTSPRWKKYKMEQICQKWGDLGYKPITRITDLTWCRML